MLTATSGLEDSGLPSVAVAAAQGVAAEVSRERRQEFEDILLHALPLFRRIARRWLRNPEDAEDAVQDAMLSAFRHIGRFDGRSKMMTWLMAIVINAIRMQIRRRPRGQMLSLEQNPAPGRRTISEVLGDRRPHPEHTLEQRELCELLDKLISSLPRSQQTALRLRLRNDFSIQEAAATLGVPEGTLKSQLARGRAALTEKFRHATGTTRAAASGTTSRVRRKVPPFKLRGDREPGLTQLPIPIFNEQVFSQQGGCEAWVEA
jgi:RNA polymerase sigma-70 factor (ECF subfamily)